jgi:hypothetical protein
MAALVTALTARTGESRVVLTSRTLPAGLDPQRVLVLPVHALSLTEAMLLVAKPPPFEVTATRSPGRSPSPLRTRP